MKEVEEVRGGGGLGGCGHSQTEGRPRQDQ